MKPNSYFFFALLATSHFMHLSAAQSFKSWVGSFFSSSDAKARNVKDSKESAERTDETIFQRIKKVYPQLSQLQLDNAAKNKAWHLIMLRHFIHPTKWTPEIKEANDQYDENIDSLIQEVLKTAENKLKHNMLTFADIQQIMKELTDYSQGIEWNHIQTIKGYLVLFKKNILFGELGSVELPQLRGNPPFAQAWYASTSDQERNLAVSYLIAQISPLARSNKKSASEYASLLNNFINDNAKHLSGYIQERARDLIKEWQS